MDWECTGCGRRYEGRADAPASCRACGSESLAPATDDRPDRLDSLLADTRAAILDPAEADRSLVRHRSPADLALRLLVLGAAVLLGAFVLGVL